MPLLALDVAFVALAGAVGIYCATARLTLLGWLIAYEEQLKSRAEVRTQIRRLTYFVFATILAGVGALLAILLRTIAEKDWVVIEGLLAAWWMLEAMLFIAFHVNIEKKEQEKRRGPTAPDPLPVHAAPQLDTDQLLSSLAEIARAMGKAGTDMADVAEKLKRARTPPDTSR